MKNRMPIIACNTKLFITCKCSIFSTRVVQSAVGLITDMGSVANYIAATFSSTIAHLHTQILPTLNAQYSIETNQNEFLDMTCHTLFVEMSVATVTRKCPNLFISGIVTIICPLTINAFVNRIRLFVHAISVCAYRTFNAQQHHNMTING